MRMIQLEWHLNWRELSEPFESLTLRMHLNRTSFHLASLFELRLTLSRIAVEFQGQCQDKTNTKDFDFTFPSFRLWSIFSRFLFRRAESEWIVEKGSHEKCLAIIDRN